MNNQEMDGDGKDNGLRNYLKKGHHDKQNENYKHDDLHG
jgi:hypothetical protein